MNSCKLGVHNLHQEGHVFARLFVCEHKNLVGGRGSFVIGLVN